MQRTYRVADEHNEKADVVLRNACRKLTRQRWYNQNITFIGHFYAEKGIRYTKPEIIRGKAPMMTTEEYMSVSKLSMRFSVGANLQLHYLFFK